MTARPSPIENPGLMTPGAVAAALRVTPQTISRACKSGRIPPDMIVLTPGGRNRIRAEWVRARLNGGAR
jgi:predicted site-specific integrase-resolvase